MSDTIHHQADPPGVTWDLTIDGQRIIVIEEAAGTTDCGYTGSRLYAYEKFGCRCDQCRAHRAEWVRARRTRR